MNVVYQSGARLLLAGGLILANAISISAQTASVDDHVHQKTTQVYGADGQLKEELHRFHRDGDKPSDWTETVVFTHDELGRISSKTKFFGEKNTDCPRDVTTFEYGEKAKFISRELTSHFRAGEREPKSQETSTFSYANGQMTSKKTDYDSNADGTPELSEISTLKRSDKGLLIDETMTRKTLPAGNNVYQTVSHFEYDKGNLKSKVTEFHDSGGERADRIEKTSFTYDANGKLQKESVDIVDPKSNTSASRTITDHQQSRIIEPSKHRVWMILGNVAVIIAVVVLLVRRKWSAAQ